EVLVEGLMDERMAEAEAAGHIRDFGDEGESLCALQDVEELIGRATGERRQSLQVEVAPDDRSGAEGGSGTFVKPRRTCAHHSANRVRNTGVTQGPLRTPVAVLVLNEGSGLGKVTEHLRDEERIAIGVAPERHGEFPT